MNVRNGALVEVSHPSLNGDAIHLADRDTLFVEKGGIVRNNAVTPDDAQSNAVQMGSFATVINHGLLETTGSMAIAAAGSAHGRDEPALIDNHGEIRSQRTRPGAFFPGHWAVYGSGSASKRIINRPGGRMTGDIELTNVSDDEITLYNDSVLTGDIKAGAGRDTLTLHGAAGTRDTLANTVLGIENLVKDGEGEWTVTDELASVGSEATTVRNGTLTLAGGNTGYAGATRVEAAGILQGAADNIPGTVIDNDGLVRFTQAVDGRYAGQINGAGIVEKTGAGVLVLAPAAQQGNTYSGGTVIKDGTLAVSADSALGAPTGGLTFNGGGFRFDDAFDLAAGRTIAVETGGGVIDTRDFVTTIGGVVAGSGDLVKKGAGTLVLTGENTLRGATKVSEGRLQIGDGGTSGSLAGPIVNDAVLDIRRSDTVTLAGVVSGTGELLQSGTGTTILSGRNVYTGNTRVLSGTLRVDGDQTAATGLTTVASGATLGGMGTIGGHVVVADGAALVPGGIAAPGTLTIAGNLRLGSGSVLNYRFGEANVPGGPLNDLTHVKGDLTLDGVLNVAVTPGGEFGPGAYRIFDYDGRLTDKGLALGTVPSADTVLQTSVAGQVNLVNTDGLVLNFWDGRGGPKNNHRVDGGNGVWQVAGTAASWTDSAGGLNAAYANGSFAVFQGAAGTVTVDNGQGTVEALGMQFAADGYRIEGDDIALVGASAATIRVGNGTDGGAGYTATIASALTGAAGLTKTDLGTLVLQGANTYAGGTRVEAGTLVAGAAGAFGAHSAFRVDAGATLALAGLDQSLASLDNRGRVAFGSRPGTTLTVAGDYIGRDGVIVLKTELAGDDSRTDRLMVGGDTAGETVLAVSNAGGGGADTVEGIKLVDIAGASNGVFTLEGDYVMDGDPVVIAGAHAYRLVKNGVSTPEDGDWYLRSTRCKSDCRGGRENDPLYQPGTPVYGAYGDMLSKLAGLGTLQQRVGDSYWRHAGTAVVPATEDGTRSAGEVVWGRIDAAHRRTAAGSSTAAAGFTLGSSRFQAGIDGVLHETGPGLLFAGVTAHFGTASAHIGSVHGDGDIATKGYGFGGTLTWLGDDGVYVDAQTQLTWFSSDLSSRSIGRLAENNKGFGYSLGIEAGKRIAVDSDWSLTPQIQLVRTAVDFDGFVDGSGARVSLDRGNSLAGRAGLSVDYMAAGLDAHGRTAHTHLYGIANLRYEFLDPIRADVAGVKVASADDALWGGLGMGGSYRWADSKYTVFGELSVNTSLANFADSSSVGGTVGLRVQW